MSIVNRTSVLLHSDLPSAKALLKRLRILANQFARE